MNDRDLVLIGGLLGTKANICSATALGGHIPAIFRQPVTRDGLEVTCLIIVQAIHTLSGRM